MTKHTQLILLNELATIRLVCRETACGATVELPISNITNGAAKKKCPGCGREFREGYNQTEADPLYRLAEAIKHLQFMDGNTFGVVFPIADQP